MVATHLNGVWLDLYTEMTMSSLGRRSFYQRSVVDKPSIMSPEPDTKVNFTSLVLKSSDFKSTLLQEIHRSSDWEISRDSSFSTIVKSCYYSQNNLTSWCVSDLEPKKTYYARVRYNSSAGTVSSWSNTLSFNTVFSNIPGLNGKVVYDIPDAIFSEEDGYQTLGMSKSNDLIINTVSKAGFNPIVYTNLTKLKKTGVGEVKTINYIGVDAEGKTSGRLLTGVFGYGFSKFGSSHVLHYLTKDDGNTKEGYTARLSTQENLTGEVDIELGGLNDLFNNNRLNDFITDFSISDDFKTLVVKQKNVGDAVVYHETVGDNGKPIYTKVTALTPPEQTTTLGFGLRSVISGDGGTIVVVKETGCFYIYKFVDNAWVFKEEIKTPMAINTIELSFDGVVIAIGFKESYAAATYTKVNGTWKNEQVLYPGDIGLPYNSEPIQGDGHCYCCVSSDGTMLSASAFKKHTRIYIYRKQANGTWGEVNVVQEPIPLNGIAVRLTKEPEAKGTEVTSFVYTEYVRALTPSGKHRLSFDGSTCLFLTDGYVLGDTQGSYKVYPPKLILAY